MPKTQRLKTGLALALALASLTTAAAEFRGRVSVQQAGLSGAHGEGLVAFPVSVALYPAEGQDIVFGAPREHEMTVSGNRIEPLYLAVKRGDRVHFRNRDGSYHELFSQARQETVLRLDRAGPDSAIGQTLSEVGDLHWFCRIHAKSYARIDVLDTPLVRMLRAGDSFEFRDLAPGKWRLRVAAPGAETRFLEVTAMTAPPPLDIELAVKGFGPGLNPPRAVTVDELFPAEPGI
ncbi:MAG: hypothetical protein ABR553_04530 [Gammaproteobacteria bacterium]